MDDIKINGKVFSGVSQVRLNTADGGTKTFRAGSVGTAELNIAYGDTAPEDTGRLWVQAASPEHVSVSWAGLGAGCELVNHGATLPVSSAGMGCVAVGKKIYLFGGKSTIGTGSTLLDTIWVFNTQTQSLTTLDTTLPEPCSGMGCAAVGKKIYLCGGNNGTADLSAIRVFDTESQTITTLSTELPNAFSPTGGCAAVDKKVYLFDEFNTYIFDTQSETVITTNAVRAGLHGTCAAAFGKKIYLFGGCVVTNYEICLKFIYVFDTESGTSSYSGVDLPKEIGRMGAEVIGSKAYLFGGEIKPTYNTSKNVNTVYVFDMETETVSTIDVTLPEGVKNMSAAAVGMVIYLFGGDGTSESLASIYEFSENVPLASGSMKIRTGTDGPVFSLISGDECRVDMTVNGVYMGNENGLAETVPAYLHDGENWVSIWGN